MRRKKSNFPLGLVVLVAMLAVAAVVLIGATISKAKSLRDQANAKQLEPRPEERKPEPKATAPVTEKVIEKAAPERKIQILGAPGGDWTHAELAAYFNAKGAFLEVQQAGQGDAIEGTLVAIFRQEQGGAEVAVYLCKGETSPREIVGSRGEGSFAFRKFAITPRWGNTSSEDAMNRRFATALNSIK